MENFKILSTELDMEPEKILYGDVFITKTSTEVESLVQYQTALYTVNGKTLMSDNTIILIDDIWKDLLSDNGTYKSNYNKGWFFWEYKKTSLDNDDVTIMEKFECPKPKEMYYDRLVDGEYTGEYANYWKERIKLARDNYEKEIAILKKEIILDPGPDYNLVNGDHVEQEKKTLIRDNPFNEIGNLLSELF